MLWRTLLAYTAFFTCFVDCRKHHLQLKDDDRPYILASSFGFQQGGLLTLTVSRFNVTSSSELNTIANGGKYGFTIDKSRNFEVAKYFEQNQETCIFRNVDDVQIMDNSTAMILLEIVENGNDNRYIKLSRKGSNIDNIQLFSCSQTLAKLKLVGNLTFMETDTGTVSASQSSDTTFPELQDCRQIVDSGQAMLLKRGNSYYFSIAVFMGHVENEGAYSVYYHNCPNYEFKKTTKSSMIIDIVERNGNSYLSVGEKYSPFVYFIMAALFLAAGITWTVVLRGARKEVFKLHYVMLVLVFLKATSLLCHGINFHFIGTWGAPIEGWAILFYITHLLKGALLFITLVLIGTGWAFIKGFLTSKEKKIFLIVIPFQVLANIAYIILEESETGDYRFTVWGYVFMLVDFFCCGCILIPIVWSIRHLSEAVGTDGKAAANLVRMKLFRRYYILVVCYIYFTRIVVMIFNMTVPFRYTYMNSVFQEGGTFVFFILTGYTFRPTRENPYLRLSQQEPDDVEMDDVVVYDRVYSDKVTLRSKTLTTIDEAEQSLVEES